LFTLSKFPPYSSSALYKFHCILKTLLRLTASKRTSEEEKLRSKKGGRYIPTTSNTGLTRHQSVGRLASRLSRDSTRVDCSLLWAIPSEFEGQNSGRIATSFCFRDPLSLVLGPIAAAEQPIRCPHRNSFAELYRPTGLPSALRNTGTF
jgi:hypothetical protein